MFPKSFLRKKKPQVIEEKPSVRFYDLNAVIINGHFNPSDRNVKTIDEVQSDAEFYSVKIGPQKIKIPAKNFHPHSGNKVYLERISPDVMPEGMVFFDSKNNIDARFASDGRGGWKQTYNQVQSQILHDMIKHARQSSVNPVAMEAKVIYDYLPPVMRTRIQALREIVPNFGNKEELAEARLSLQAMDMIAQGRSNSDILAKKRGFLVSYSSRTLMEAFLADRSNGIIDPNGVVLKPAELQQSEIMKAPSEISSSYQPNQAVAMFAKLAKAPSGLAKRSNIR